MAQRVAAWHCRATNHWENYEDLAQECALAGWVALPRWDPDKGAWSTFLIHRMKGALYDALRQWDIRTRRDIKDQVEAFINPLSEYEETEEEHHRTHPALYHWDSYEEAEDRAAVLSFMRSRDWPPHHYEIAALWLHDRYPMKQIGEFYGVTESRVSQLVKKLLAEAELQRGLEQEP